MRMRSRLFPLSLLLPASLLLGVSVPASAQDDHANMSMPVEAPARTMPQSRWSDPQSWPDGKVPGAGDAVTIARDRSLILDVSPPALRSLTISGKLSFADDRDINLTTEWIYLAGGELEIGSEARPHTRNAVITLTDNVPHEDINTMGDRGILMLRGTLSLHGDRTNAWTKLAKTAKAGSAKIEVLNASNWRKGDVIVLASTDFNPRQAEKRTISAISGNRLTLDKPLTYMHFGEITFGVDERGEVGLLSRNIKIQASEDAEKSYFGGHIMAMAGSKMFLSGIELNRMGQHMQLARYPIHWHIIGEGQGQYIRNASIHDSFNRCVTVHGTNNLRIENNVTYNTVGHCFFLEDGIEHGNAFIKNLAIQTKCHPSLNCVPTNLAANGELNYASGDRAAASAAREASFHGGNTLLPSDNTVASFWITNPDNSFIDNVAAGSDENGFWLSLPEHPNGAFLGSEASLKTWPRRTPLRAFRGNVAHSNFDGFMFDRNIYEDNTFGTATIPFLPLENPADLESEAVESHFENLTSYKNRNGGLWGRGDLFIYSNAKFADNAIGMTQAAGDIGSQRFHARLIDSLVVGETANIGNPTTPEEVAYGRSLPKTLIPDFPIRGYEYYDYRGDVVNTTFVNFQDNDRRKTGALSFLLYTSAGVSTGSTISGAQFVNAKPVYFPKIDPRFDNDNRGGVGYRTLSFRDLDGSVTGIPNSHVMLHDGENDSVATDDSCEIHPTWNASVCTGDVGRLNLSDSRGELPGTVDLESRTARFALLASIGPNAPDTPLVQSQRAALFSRRPPQAPIALGRNGKEFKITGDQSTVRAGTEIQVKTERPQVTLSLAEMDQGSWVIFELPGFTNAASGTEKGSMDALRQANETSYFRGGDALWVKLVADAPVMPVIRPTDLQASIAVSR
ncbi:MAG TPA: G8 domain-containing protein [Sphingobium sp.]|nr:G8 domain-containing protein [Sphingobium sp.]